MPADSGVYVVGLDSSTQSAKAIAWDRRGNAAAEGRAPIELRTPQPGRAEQDVEDWWSSAVAALAPVVEAVGAGAIEALAISNQRETVAFLDAEGQAIAPAIVWLDERALETLDSYAERMGRQWLHEISGKPVDLTPVVYRLDWLRRKQPEVLDGAARIVDVHGFLTGRLTGCATASWTSADPFGIFDIRAMDWSEPILESLGIARRQLPAAVRPGSRVGTVTPEAARATGLRAGTPVYAAGGDGQCAGLGVNAIREGLVYLNLGTALITGVYSASPRTDRAWRTMTAATGEGYFLEGVQRAGAFLVNWLVDLLAGGRRDEAIFGRLEQAAVALPVGAEGVTVCPYFAGCMDPHWDPKARGAFVGLSASHGPGHLFRAVLEALTLESANALEAMRAKGLAFDRIRAIGGGARSDLWLSMMADATGLPVERSSTVEASALGAGITAAVGVGWYSGFAEAAEAMTQEQDRIEPDAARAPEWRALAERQKAIYLDTRRYRAP